MCLMLSPLRAFPVQHRFCRSGHASRSAVRVAGLLAVVVEYLDVAPTLVRDDSQNGSQL